MRLEFAISPCPNDTFIYGAIANGLVPTDYQFDFEYLDIQALNEKSQIGKGDLIKMSYFNYFKVEDQYRLLPCGGALGRSCGPLLISKHAQLKITPQTRIAVPGMHTTATFLLKYFLPEHSQLIPMTFDLIEEAILSGQVDAGVIIHENRFTYTQKGLQLIQDLGIYWEASTKAPIPLGCLAINRRLPESLDESITQLVRQSMDYARNYFDALLPYILDHAQAMTMEVVQAHIDLYVNDFSYDIGPDGRLAIESMRNILKAQV